MAGDEKVSSARALVWADKLRSGYDVVVIGGGAHGLAAAHYLAREHGVRDVAVLEAGTIGRGNSGRNTAIVRSNYLTPEGVRFYQASVRLWESLGRELDIQLFYSRRGHLTLAHTEGTLRTMRWRAGVNQHLGVDSELVDRGEIARLCPAQAIEAEVRGVRERVGIIDVNTLGKIDATGRDAGALLEQVYTGKFTDMRVGSSRYALLCDDAGAVVDDGIVARFADNRFYVTTTTSASAAVYRELQRRAIELACEVVLTNLSGAIAAFNVAGPLAPRVVAAAADDPARVLGLPYLGAAETTFDGVTARVLRVGFVGEVAYELHVAAGAAMSAWRRLIELGAGEGLRPFGVEAQRMLRLEKGHLVVGQDTDALSTPFEVGLGWAVKMQKASFVGRRSLAIRSARPASRALVGFELTSERDADGTDVANGADVRDGAEVAEEADVAEVKECHLVIDGVNIVGRVTSVGRSPSLGRTIGLAFVAPASASPGCSFTIRVDRGRRVGATVVATPFFDPQNRRQNEAAPA